MAHHGSGRFQELELALHIGVNIPLLYSLRETCPIPCLLSKFFPKDTCYTVRDLESKSFSLYKINPIPQAKSYIHRIFFDVAPFISWW